MAIVVWKGSASGRWADGRAGTVGRVSAQVLIWIHAFGRSEGVVPLAIDVRDDDRTIIARMFHSYNDEERSRVREGSYVEGTSDANNERI